MRSERHRVMTEHQNRYNRMSHLLNQFLPVTVTDRTTSRTHNPRISAQTVTNLLREMGIRPLYIFYKRCLVFWPSIVHASMLFIF